MMATMREAADEFGRYLRKLRRERKWGSTGLSEAVGKHRTYIGLWEKDASVKVNRAVLHQVCEALKLSEPEKQQLFSLADRRNRPAGVTEQLSETDRMLVNVHAALSEVPYTLPDDIAGKPQGLWLLGECGSSLLTYWAIIGPEYGVEKFHWPDDIYENKIVDSSWRKDAAIDFPPELMATFAPRLKVPNDLTEAAARTIGEAMADLIRRYYLSDLDRCREAAHALRRWSLVDDDEAGLIVQFRSVNPDEGPDVPWPGMFPSDRQSRQRRSAPPDPIGIHGVRLPIAESYLRRDVIAHVWEGLSGRKRIDPLGEYPHQFDFIDSTIYPTYILAKGFLSDRKPLGKMWLQSFRDALYILRSTAWGSIRSAGVLARQMFDVHEDDVEIPPKVRRELDNLSYWGNAMVAEYVEKVFDAMAERLGKAEEMMTRALQRSASAGTTEDTESAPKAKSTRRRKRKKAKAKKKRKRT